MSHLAIWMLACSLAAQSVPPAVLDQISADSLRGHLSFIASDLLEGRDTPSRGLDLAAEYIAAQFRRAGLEPGGDQDYFQTARMLQVEVSLEGFELKFEREKQVIPVGAGKISVRFPRELRLSGTPVYWAPPAAIGELKRDPVRGKVLVTESPRRDTFRAVSEAVRGLEPAVAIYLSPAGTPARRPRASLIDPETRASAATPLIVVSDGEVLQAFRGVKPGATDWTISLRLPAPIEKPARLRNVAGILRGSDPGLKDTCVLLTAHYDHLGVAASGESDRIYNGANDDGSGTVSVIEIAAALAKAPQRPHRSIVFLTFFGEEKGTLGSQYYVRHPACPLEKTVADVNLEQLGRTDSSDGLQISNASLTGFDYSDLAGTFQRAGELTGVRVYKDEKGSDMFFARSDNQTFATRGIPSTTVAVAFLYADYHGVGDEWNKIDYANLAKVTRMLALGTLMLADQREAPRWNESNPKAARYLEAWKKLHPRPAASGTNF